jgi:hypothetical protein
MTPASFVLWAQAMMDKPCAIFSSCSYPSLDYSIWAKDFLVLVNQMIVHGLSDWDDYCRNANKYGLITSIGEALYSGYPPLCNCAHVICNLDFVISMLSSNEKNSSENMFWNFNGTFKIDDYVYAEKESTQNILARAETYADRVLELQQETGGRAYSIDTIKKIIPQPLYFCRKEIQ